MRELWLVRHGQTQPLHVDGYVDLTPLGLRQAQRLGAALQSVVPSQVWVGPQPRHAQTLDAARQPAWPEARLEPGLDEHDGIRVLQAVLTETVGPQAVRDRAAARLARGDAGAVMAGFRVVMAAWAEGELEVPGTETWAAFRARVVHTLPKMSAGEGEGPIVAFTSGGFIGMAVAVLLGVEDVTTVMDLAFAVENTSVTVVKVGRSRASLWRFNGVGHLGGDVPPTSV